MSGFGFELSGFDQVIENLEGYGEVPENVAQAALLAGAKPMEDAIRANTPVRVGTLVSSIRTGAVKGRSITTGSFKKKGAHARLVEYGHGGPKPAPPHPFVAPAYEATKDTSYEQIAEVMRGWLGG